MSKLSRLVVPLALAVLLVSCDSGSGSATPSPTTSGLASAAAPPSRTPSPSPAPRDAATVRKALIGLKDLPPGFRVVLDQVPHDDGMSVSSKDPRCARFVRHFEETEPPGSRTTAYRAFARGDLGPYIDVRLDVLASADAVAALQAQYRSAVRNCARVTLTIPGQGSSPLRVREVSPPRQGTGPFAARFVATGGELPGLELTVVTTGVDDVLLTMTYTQPGAFDIDGTTRAAVDKVEAVL